MLAGAAITGLLVMLFLSWALIWLLDNWMPVELAALIVAVLWAIVTARAREHRPQDAAAGKPAAAADATDPQGGRIMGTSTEELSNDIARTRADLEQDLDALQDKVSPSAIMERRKSAVRGRLASAKDRVMGTGQSVVGSVRTPLTASAAPPRTPAALWRTGSREVHWP